MEWPNARVLLETYFSLALWYAHYAYHNTNSSKLPRVGPSTEDIPLGLS